jgi:DNA-binding transcriptional ArsR family regulator
VDVAAAISDPVRREILVMLRSGPMPAGQIADRFMISRPAISRHLRVLRESDLVRDELIGRERHYTLHTEPLAELMRWLEVFAVPAELDRRLDALETEVRRTRRERETKTWQTKRRTDRTA